MLVLITVSLYCSIYITLYLNNGAFLSIKLKHVLYIFL